MKIITATLTLLWALASAVQAHELEANRATLVLRDQQHLALTFFVDYPAVLHQVLAPQLPLTEFVLMHSAMQPQAFAAQLQIAQTKLQSSTGLTLHKGKAAVLTQWVWPKAVAVQNLLQQRAMQAVVAPTDHGHVVQSEIRVEVKSVQTGDFASVKLQLPAEFKEVLVVSYQPKQVWVKPRTPSTAITF
jgi:hypothetical protein